MSISKTKKKSSKKKVEITKDMTIFQAMRMRPDSVEKLLNMGMGCGGCQFAMMETIEQGAMVHGLDVKKVLKELNS
jgi:hybrid cluster-associated redox disulfide protein